MAENFKASNYVKIVNETIPEISQSKNPLDLGNIPNFPTLKQVVVMSDNQYPRMLKF